MRSALVAIFCGMANTLNWKVATLIITHVLAARDSMLIMQCQVWKADLSIGGMTKCRTCSQPFSRTYAMMLRSSHTFRPWQPRSLTSSANSSDEARLDISAHGFWKRGQGAFFDVRVFNPFEKSHLNQKLDTAFSSNENEKKRHYNQRLLLKSSRLPTALSCSHHMEEIAEKQITISHWTSPEVIREKANGV